MTTYLAEVTCASSDFNWAMGMFFSSIPLSAAIAACAYFKYRR